MSSNYPAIVTAIAARLASVVEVPWYAYDPKVYPSDMHGRIIGAKGEPILPTYGEKAMQWDLTGRLAVRYTNNEQAELLLAAKVPALISAFDQDLDAGGTIADGQVSLRGFAWHYVTVGQTTPTDYRTIDFTISFVERFPETYE